jgi:hypothetical protein
VIDRKYFVFVAGCPNRQAVCLCVSREGRCCSVLGLTRRVAGYTMQYPTLISELMIAIGLIAVEPLMQIPTHIPPLIVYTVYTLSRREVLHTAKSSKRIVEADRTDILVSGGLGTTRKRLTPCVEVLKTSLSWSPSPMYSAPACCRLSRPVPVSAVRSCCYQVLPIFRWPSMVSLLVCTGDGVSRTDVSRESH